MNFDDAFTRLLGNEGKLSLDKHDSGNWTGGRIGKGVLRGSKYGISAASYPTLDIVNLSEEQAKEIYKRDYWDKLHASRRPDYMGFNLFDTAVNSGVSKAIKLLQKVVGVKEDGIIGSITFLAVEEFDDNYSPMAFSISFNANRLLFLTDLPAWSTQGKGWARRIAHNLLQDYD